MADGVKQGNDKISVVRRAFKSTGVVDEQPDKAAKEGILALQLRAEPPMLVEFKDIRLKRLP